MPFPDRFDTSRRIRRPTRRRRNPMFAGFLVLGGVLAVLVAVGAAVYLSLPNRAKTDNPNTLAVDLAGGGDGMGLRMIVPQKFRADQVVWARLTPFDHPVYIQAPGSPKAIAAGRHVFEMSLNKSLRGWEAVGPNEVRYFLIEGDAPPPGVGPGPGQFYGRENVIETANLYCGGVGKPTPAGVVAVNGVMFECFDAPRHAPPPNFPLRNRPPASAGGHFSLRVVYAGPRCYVFGLSGKTPGTDDALEAAYFASFRSAAPPR